MAKKDKEAPAAASGPGPDRIVLQAPAGVETIGTEAGVMGLVAGRLILDSADAGHRALARQLCLHHGFTEVAK